jgi:hypothetical protein
MKRDWDIVTSYIDNVGTSEKTVLFPKPQESVKVTNKGNTNLIYTIGTKSGTLAPNGSVTVNEVLTNFSLRAETGVTEYEVRASEAGTEQEENTPILPDDVAGKLEELSSSLAQMSTEINEPFHLRVGKNQKYKTILAAVQEWENPATINKQPTVIHIYKGVYKEKIYRGGTSNLSFIGENKKDVIWKTTSGYYDDSPLVIGGNVYIKGITFIADITENPSYTYTAYSGANTGAAYALHIDDTTAVGEVVVEDCDMISYVNAALGSGTRINQQIKLVNCNLYSYCNISAVKVNGALLYHTSAIAGATNQKFTAKNCYFHSEYDKPLNIQSVGDNTVVPIEFLYCTVKSGTLALDNSLVAFSYAAGATQVKTTLTENSCGNNVEALNSPASSWQKAILTKLNGTALSVTDFNNAQSGFFMGNGGAGVLNTPSALWYIGMAIKYSEGGSPYIVQYAWAMTDSFKKYKRTCTNGTWSAWGLCSDLNSDIITQFRQILNIASTGYTNFIADANSADRCGYYYANVNTPTAAVYMIHHIGYDANNAVQEAFANGTGAKHRRVKNAGAWGAWASA